MSETSHWKAPAVLTIYEVSELPDVLNDITSGSNTWSIDLSDLNELDSCGCQLLMLMNQVASVSAKSLTFVHVNDLIKQQLSLFGANSIFDDVLLPAQSPAQIKI